MLCETLAQSYEFVYLELMQIEALLAVILCCHSMLGLWVYYD